MSIGSICRRGVVMTKAGSTITDAARLMRKSHVGDLLVVDERNDAEVLVGMITDRDIVLEVIAKRADPDTVMVGQIMTPAPVTVGETCGVFDTIRIMKKAGVRRLPVVTQGGRLMGIVAMDDIVGMLSRELSAITQVVRREIGREKKARP